MEIQPTETFGIARFLQLEKTVGSLSANIEKLVHVSCDHGERLRELYEKLYHAATKIELSSSLGNTKVTLQKFQNKLEEQISENQQQERKFLQSIITGKLNEYTKRSWTDTEHEKVNHHLHILEASLSETQKSCGGLSGELKDSALHTENLHAELASELQVQVEKVSALEKANAQLVSKVKDLESKVTSSRGRGGGGGEGGDEGGSSLLPPSRIKELRMAGLLPKTGSDQSIIPRSSSRRSSVGRMMGGDNGGSRALLPGRTSHGHGHGHGHGQGSSRANLHGQGHSHGHGHGSSSKANLNQASKLNLRGQSSNSSLHGTRGHGSGSHHAHAHGHGHGHGHGSSKASLHGQGHGHAQGLELNSPHCSQHNSSPSTIPSSLSRQALAASEREAATEVSSGLADDESVSSPDTSPIHSFMVITEEPEESNPSGPGPSPKNKEGQIQSALAFAASAAVCEEDSNPHVVVEAVSEALASQLARSSPPPESSAINREPSEPISGSGHEELASLGVQFETETEPAPELAAAPADAAKVPSSEEPSRSRSDPNTLSGPSQEVGSHDLSEDMEFSMPGFGADGKPLLSGSGTAIGFDSRSRSESYASINDSLAGSEISGSRSYSGSMDSFQLLREDVLTAHEDMRTRLMAVEAAMGGGTHRVDDLEVRNEKMHDALRLLDGEHSALLAAHKAAAQERAITEASLFATLEHVVSISNVLQTEMGRHETQLQRLGRKLEKGLAAATAAASGGAAVGLAEEGPRHSKRVGGTDTSTRQPSLNAIPEKEERLLDGFATHQLTLPALGSMKELLAGIPSSGTSTPQRGAFAKYGGGESTLDFGLSLHDDGDGDMEGGELSGVAPSGGKILNAEDLARLRAELLLEVEKLPGFAGGGAKVEAAAAQVAELDAGVRRLSAEQSKLVTAHGGMQQEIALLRKIVRTHSLSLTKRQAMQAGGSKLPVCEVGLLGDAVPESSKARAEMSSRGASAGPGSGSGGMVVKLPVTSTATTTERASLSLQASDPRLVEPVGPVSHPSPPVKPPSRIRQSFEQRSRKNGGAPAGHIAAVQASPIRYSGERLWAHAREADGIAENSQASLNSEDARVCYNDAYGNWPEERDI